MYHIIYKLNIDQGSNIEEIKHSSMNYEEIIDCWQFIQLTDEPNGSYYLIKDQEVLEVY